MRTMLVLACCSLRCGVLVTARRREVSTDEAKQLLIDRNWLDRMPETERDKLHVYRFVPNMGGGVFQDRTLYKGTFELFSFKVDGDDDPVQAARDQEKVTSEFTIEKVDGPAPFDLKLTISTIRAARRSTSACAPRPIATASRSSSASRQLAPLFEQRVDCPLANRPWARHQCSAARKAATSLRAATAPGHDASVAWACFAFAIASSRRPSPARTWASSTSISAARSVRLG